MSDIVSFCFITFWAVWKICLLRSDHFLRLHSGEFVSYLKKAKTKTAKKTPDKDQDLVQGNDLHYWNCIDSSKRAERFCCCLICDCRVSE